MFKPEKSSAEQNLLSDILNEGGKPKVKLTPEIEKEIRKHLAEAQARAERGEPMTQEMKEVMENVRLWVGMPEAWRNRLRTVEEMTKYPLIIKAPEEAKQRHISVRQWLDLLHMAQARAERGKKRWIDQTFLFPGGGKIDAKSLDLGKCTGLTILPEGLVVREMLYLGKCTGLQKNKDKLLPLLLEKVKEGEIGGLNLWGWPLGDGDFPKGLKVVEGLELVDCTGLTSLPEGLEVGWVLNLRGCTGLTSLPEGLKVGGNLILDGCSGLTELPEGLRVRGRLEIDGCTGLTSLPKGLKVDGALLARGTGLTSLPDDLIVEGRLTLSKESNDQAKKDAERLQAEGKINGGIIYP